MHTATLHDAAVWNVLNNWYEHWLTRVPLLLPADHGYVCIYTAGIPGVSNQSSQEVQHKCQVHIADLRSNLERLWNKEITLLYHPTFSLTNLGCLCYKEHWSDFLLRMYNGHINKCSSNKAGQLEESVNQWFHHQHI